MPVNAAALADNGGPTLPHALQADSAAIDSGDATICASIATDQRGATRCGPQKFMV